MVGWDHRQYMRLGLDISRAEITESNQNRFYVTDHQSSEKITASARLEDLRQTVLTTMCYYHPEAQEFVQQTARNSKPYEVADDAETEYVTPTKKKRQIVPTRITVTSVSNGTKSKLLIETTDRPGLLSEIVRVLKDLNLIGHQKLETINLSMMFHIFIAISTSLKQVYRLINIILNLVLLSLQQIVLLLEHLI